MALYQSMSYSKDDIQVVPDDGYNSPADSPYYSIDSVGSPAGSVTSSVDSAFDELKEVIPEFLESEYPSVGSPKEYQEMAVMSPYASSMHSEKAIQMTDQGLRNSPNLYQAASPAMSESDYENAFSPSNELMKAVKQASTKRSYSQWQGSTVDLTCLPNESQQPAKKRKVSDSFAIARYAEVLLSLDAHKKEKKGQTMFFYSENDDSGIETESFKSPVSNSNDNQISLTQSLFTLDDDILTNNFAVLAEYLEGKPKENSPSVVPNVSNGAKIEVKKEIKVINSEPASQYAQKELPVVNHDGASVTEISRVTTINTDHLAATKQFKEEEPVSSKLVKSVDQWCSGVIPKAEGVVFFNAPSQTQEQDGQALYESNSSKVIVKQETADGPTWKVPVRPKRSHIMVQMRKPRLYNFLLELLHDSRYKCIEWVDANQGIFKFLDSGEVARLWGQRKNKPNMKYENFARSLRTYIAKGILMKPRNKLVYQFTSEYLL